MSYAELAFGEGRRNPSDVSDSNSENLEILVQRKLGDHTWKQTNLLSRVTIRAPSTSNPSSVRVPVLSKQTMSSFPPTLTLVSCISIEVETLFSFVHSLLWADTEYVLFF